MDYFKQLYEAASLNDAVRLNKLLEHEILSANLEDLLSKVCMQLQLNCVYLTDETKLILDRKLLNLRFSYKPPISNLSSQEICDRIAFTIKLIRNLPVHGAGNDELFNFSLTFIAKQIFTLKKLLKLTYDEMPWEEIEFCMLTYIRTFKEQNDIMFISRTILSKSNLIRYLTIYGDHLEKLQKYVIENNQQELNKFPNIKRDEAIEGIIAKEPEFKSLYNDYEILRDIHSLNFMLSYVKVVKSIKFESKYSSLILMRSLQVIGEHLKNTLESPKLSQTTINYLLMYFSSNTRDMIINLRNRLSHNQFPSERKELLESLETDHLIGIKSDIIKMGNKITHILAEYKIKILRELCDKVLNTEDEEVMNEVIDATKILELNSFSKGDITELEKIDVITLKDLISQLHDKVKLKSVYIEFLFAEINSILKENSVKRLMNNTKNVILPFHILKYSFFIHSENSNGKANSIRSLKSSLRKYISSLSPQIEPSKLNIIVELIISINNLLSEYSENAEVRRLIMEIIHILKFDVNRVTWAEKFERKLHRVEMKEKILNENIGNVSKRQKLEKLAQLREVFNGISYSKYKKDRNIQAVIEILLLDLIPSLKYPNLKSRLFFLDENYPTIMGSDLRNHLAHNNAIIDVLLDSTSATFVFVQTLLKVEETQNFNSKDFRFYDISHIEKSYFSCTDILNKKQDMFTTLKEKNLEAFCKCLEKGADFRSRNMEMSTCLHLAMNNPESLKLAKFLWKNGLSSELKNVEGQTPLHSASLTGNLQVVEFLLDNLDIEINDVDQFGRTALHFACLGGNEHVVNILLLHSADSTKKDNMFQSPLQYAVTSGKNAVIEVFFERDLFHKLNECPGGITTLHMAAESGFEKTVEYLLSKKLKVDAREDLGTTPLHLAVSNGHLEIVETLLCHGADVNSRNIKGDGPMHCACETNGEEIVKVLITHGADVNIIDISEFFAPIHYVTKYGFLGILKILLANNANVNLATRRGFTPLYYAVEGGYLKLVEILLAQKDIKVNSPDMMGITPLHVAASDGNAEIVKLLIKKGARMDCESIDGVTPLHVAAQKGHEAVVNLLIANPNISVQARTTTGKLLPLHSAAESGNKNIIKKLIAEGSDINATTSDGSNCLHLAIRNKKNIADLLLNEGIKLDVKTKERGFTPLHVAVLTDNLKMVETLLKAGSQIDAQDRLGNTPTHLAVEKKSIEIFSFLLENGSNIKFKNKSGRTPFSTAVIYNMIKFIELCMSSSLIDDEVVYKSLEEAICNDNTKIVKVLLKQSEYDFSKYRDSKKNTFLHLAAMFRSVNSVELLLKYGLEVDLKNEYGFTPLFLAATNGCDEILEILLRNGAQINIQICDGETPLHIISTKNHRKCLEILLDQGADVNIQDKKKRLAVELAVSSGHLELIRLYLKMNSNHLNRMNHEGFTLLHIAAQFGHTEVVEFLISEGANMHSRNENGSMPIHIAAREGFTDIIEIFIKKGMDLDVRGITNNSKNSLLHYAASAGKVEVLKFLLERGCNVNSGNNKGQTPLHYAAKYGFKEVVKYLLDNAAIYNISQPMKRQMCIDEEIEKIISSVTKLFSFIKAGDLTKIKEIIKEGVPLNCVDINKGSPLHFAVYKGNVEVVEILLRNKVWTNTVHKNGWTPLHYAAKYSHVKIVFLLLWNGAKYDFDSDNGKKPIDFAENTSVRNLLQLIDDCFAGAQKKSSNIITRLNKIKDIDVIKAVMRAENKHGTTLITAAIKNKYSRINELENIFQENVPIELEAADSFLFQEKYEKANEIYQSIYQKRRNIFGDDNPATLSIKSKIAASMYKLHLYQQALTCMEETYGKLKKILGINHERALRERSGMALILHRQGRNKESLEMFEEVYPIQKKLLPPDHDDLFKTMMHMGLVLMSINELDRALKLYNEVLKIDSNSMVAKNNMALIFSRQGQNEKALKLFEEVYQVRKSTLGPYHSDTLRALQNKLKIFINREEYDEAFEEYNKLLKCQKQHLGPQHFDTLDTQFDMAMLNMKLGKFVPAFKILKEIKDKKMAIQGANHAQVIQIVKHMEIIMEVMVTKTGCSTNLNSFIEELVSNMNEAAKKGDIDTVKKLLSSGVGVGEKDIEGRTSLHFAVDGNKIEVVKLLLENNADVTEKTNKGNTVLHTACNKGYQDIIELILRSVNANKLSYLINSATNIGKMTALHVAAKQGFSEIVRILLKNGAVYNCLNKDGKTPKCLAEDESVKNILQLTDDLFLAFKNGEFSVFSRLYKFEKNDFLCVTNAKDLQNCTLLNLLILKGNIGLARNLTERITKMNI